MSDRQSEQLMRLCKANAELGMALVEAYVEIDELKAALRNLRSHIANHGHPEDGTMCKIIDAALSKESA